MVNQLRIQRLRRWASFGVFFAAMLITGCNSLFGIREGAPRRICDDELLIDDMEDGDGFICASAGRHGSWFDLGDTSGGARLTPRQDLPFTPTPLEGQQGASRYAAHFSGTGFDDWGALMGFNLNDQGFAGQPYDVRNLGGIKFRMKSNRPISVQLRTPQTIALSEGGQCLDDNNPENCNNHFSFPITAPSKDWAEYEVPFTALRQHWYGGSAPWDPRMLIGISFNVGPSAPFDVWIDDIRFYYCSTSACRPTCKDPAFPVSCPASPRSPIPAGCWPPGTDCAAVDGFCKDLLLIDDMEDGDATICRLGKRDGSWFVAHDLTSANVTPKNSPFIQTEIPGGRDNSRYAARLTGSGLLAWGAQMGPSLNNFDASQFSGIKFWLKSDVPINVQFVTPATANPNETNGVGCQDGDNERNCDFPYSFNVGANGNEWVEYTVPFAALRQAEPFHGLGNLLPGTAAWDPSHLLRINFGMHLSAFDFWIDDLRFYTCKGESCLPSCPAETVACPASGGRPADCWPKGTDCSKPPERLTLWAVWGSSPNDVWIVGYGATTLKGTMLHWNGTAWSPDTSGPRPPMFAVRGSGPSDLWAMGDWGTILHRSGSTWSTVSSGTESTFNGIWGSGSSDVWAIEFPSTMRHWDGIRWSTDIKTDGHLTAVWGTGPQDVWAVGTKTTIHWDGSVWSTTGNEGSVLLGIWGSGANDVWAVGGAGAIVHWDGSRWLAFPGATSMALNGVWGTGPSDVWAVGDNGTIVHWDGAAWLAFSSGTNQQLNAVWGSGPNDVWVVGYGSTILHWDGLVWSASSP